LVGGTKEKGEKNIQKYRCFLRDLNLATRYAILHVTATQMYADSETLQVDKTNISRT